jgi:hypothetical protein
MDDKAIRALYDEVFEPKGFRRICLNELGSLTIVEAAITDAVNSGTSFVVDCGRQPLSDQKRYIETINELGCERVECWYLRGRLYEASDEKVIDDVSYATHIVYVLNSRNKPEMNYRFITRERPDKKKRSRPNFIDHLFMNEENLF